MAQLTVSWSADDEYLGVLRGIVTSGDFSGHGSDWFDWQDIKDTIIAPLGIYPLSATELPRTGRGISEAV